MIKKEDHNSNYTRINMIINVLQQDKTLTIAHLDDLWKLRSYIIEVQNELTDAKNYIKYLSPEE